MTGGAKHPVRTTEKTLRLVEALREADGAGVTELADRVDMGKSAVHNHLSTLREYGYVVKEGDTYRTGLKFLEVGGQRRKRMELYDAAESRVNELAQRSGELCNLLTEERGVGVYLYRAKGDDAVDLDTHAGRRTHLHTTALGKAILAHLPRSRVEEILDRRGLPAETERSITDRATLFEELDRVRERGHAVDDEERLAGLRCVAVPVRTSDGRVLGAISISSPRSRMKGDRLEREVPEMVRDAANVVELDINYA